jgi:hypothetical protein
MAKISIAFHLQIGVVQFGENLFPLGAIYPMEPDPLEFREIGPVCPDEESPLVVSIGFADDPIFLIDASQDFIETV